MVVFNMMGIACLGNRAVDNQLFCNCSCELLYVNPTDHINIDLFDVSRSAVSVGCILKDDMEGPRNGRRLECEMSSELCCVQRSVQVYLLSSEATNDCGRPPLLLLF